MQVFLDLWIQWSNCPYLVAKKDLHWNYFWDKEKSGYFAQNAKICSTPTNAVDEVVQVDAVDASYAEDEDDAADAF